MNKNRVFTTCAIGFALLTLSFAFPWSTYTSFTHSGNRQTSAKVSRPLFYMLKTGRKEILWGELAIQSCAIASLTAAASFWSSQQK